MPTALPPVRVGQAVPALNLLDLRGQSAPLTGNTGEPTVLLFWNNGCGFCRAMLNDLRAWDENPPPGAPRLVVISSGSAEENCALNLRGRVLLDNEQQAVRRFGANGTPMAVLLDSEARVASPVVGGAAAVFDLVRVAVPPKADGATIKETVPRQ
jgi:thiol-disulfide isomerase/thioredoxin